MISTKLVCMREKDLMLRTRVTWRWDNVPSVPLNLQIDAITLRWSQVRWDSGRRSRWTRDNEENCVLCTVYSELHSLIGRNGL